MPEDDREPDRSDGLDPVWNLWNDDSDPVRFDEKVAVDRRSDLVLECPGYHVNLCPHPALGRMIPGESRRQRCLVELPGRSGGNESVGPLHAVAKRAIEFGADHRVSRVLADDPRSIDEWRSVTHVLWVSAIESGDPVAVFVAAKTPDGAFHPEITPGVDRTYHHQLNLLLQRDGAVGQPMAHFDDVTELDNGIRGQTLHVPSANPTGFFQAISATDSMPGAEILAKLFMPAGRSARPVVVVVPGSLGVGPSHLASAKLLTDRGIAACVVDPFGLRGVESTVANQVQYSFAASAWDVLATVRVLCSRSDVDIARIGAQGHSRGGSAVLSAACMAQLVDDVPAAMRGVYAAYPWSGLQFLKPDIGAAVVRSVIGDRDEWCSPQQVQAHMHAMRLCGGRASCRIFGEAHHGFDRDTPLEAIEDAAVAPAAPTVYVREDGALIHPLAQGADPDLSERDVMVYSMKAGYGRRGARIGSEGDQAELFREDMMRFWEALMFETAD